MPYVGTLNPEGSVVPVTVDFLINIYKCFRN